MKVFAVICLLVLGVTVRAQLIEETQDLMGAYLLSRPMMGNQGFGMNPYMPGSVMPAIPPMGMGMGMMMPYNYMFGKRK